MARLRQHQPTVDLLQVGDVVDMTGGLFVPSVSRTARVTFAWLEGGRLRGKVLPDGRIATVVVVWPTTARGHVTRAWDDTQVLEWHLTLAEIRALRRWTDLWPPDRHDFLVGANITPCPTTLRSTEHFERLRDHADCLIHSVMSNVSTNRAMSSGRGRQ